MHRRKATIIPFPVNRSSAASTAPAASARATSEPVRSAALAGAAAAEAVAGILGACDDGDAAKDDMDASKAANLGVLWGAVLGIAKCHGQIPALAALEQIRQRLHEDPHGLITEPQHEASRGGTTRAVQALLKQG